MLAGLLVWDGTSVFACWFQLIQRESLQAGQRIQRAAGAYRQGLQDSGVEISMTDRGQAGQDGWAHRLTGTSRWKEVDLSERLDYNDGCRQIGASWLTCMRVSGSAHRWAI